MDYEITNDNLTLVVSSVGAKPISLKDSEGCELLWCADPEYWDDHAPVLFPMCGRCFEGKYFWHGKVYEMPIHGFLPNSHCRTRLVSPCEIEFLLASDEKTKAIYPFDFELSVSYRLSGNSVIIKAEVHSECDTLPFSLGLHPGFACNSDPNVKFADGVSPEKIKICQNGLLGQGREPFALGSDAILHINDEVIGSCGLFLQNCGDRVILSVERHCISVDFPGFPVLGFWRAFGAKFICIEPWTGLPASDGVPTDLENKPYTTYLKKDEIKKYEVTITVD